MGINLANPYEWHMAIPNSATPPYRYQMEYMVAAESLIDAAIRRDIPPGTRAVLMASRQAGKNESSGRMEARVLAKYSDTLREAVKSAPVAIPTLHISKQRLKRILDAPIFRENKNYVRWEEGFICRVGRASMSFLSGEVKANRVGHTASLFLSIDEAQDFDQEVYNKDLRPMLLQTGAITLLSGTSWIKDSLIEVERERARHIQKRLGIRLLYEYPWDVVAEDNHQYGLNVQAEIAVLGEDHPIVASQYKLCPVDALGHLFSEPDQVKLLGSHPRLSEPREGRMYVAGVDWSGASEQDEAELLRGDDVAQKRDSTVVTIGEIVWQLTGTSVQPFLRIVDHLCLKGMQPEEMLEPVYRFVFEKWRCRYCVADASGAGNFPSYTLAVRRPEQVKPLVSSLAIVSETGYALLGAVKSGRLKMYRGEDRNSEEFWLQVRMCRREIRPGGFLRFYAPTRKMAIADGPLQTIHDDYVKSLAYCLHAARQTEQLSHLVYPAGHQEEFTLDTY